ncbi:Uncharacterised protein [Vibrio cholerae]|nr:Uncharacterised protein [Vibrio cholerae]
MNHAKSAGRCQGIWLSLPIMRWSAIAAIILIIIFLLP